MKRYLHPVGTSDYSTTPAAYHEDMQTRNVDVTTLPQPPNKDTAT